MAARSPAGARAKPLTDASLARWPLPALGADADKEARGRVLIVAGSHEIPGAAMLAGVAALRAGAGKLTIAVPERVASGLALASPEARVRAIASAFAQWLASRRSIRAAAAAAATAPNTPGL